MGVEGVKKKDPGAGAVVIAQLHPQAGLPERDHDPPRPTARNASPTPGQRFRPGRVRRR